MTRGRKIVFLGALCGLLGLALPTLAAARIAYITGSTSLPYAAPVDLVTQTTGGEINFFGEGAPRAVAITPDGSTAYVPIEEFGEPSSFSELVPIDVATNTREPSIELSSPGGAPWGVAITPDGSRAYVSNRSEESVTPVDLATRTAGTPIPVEGEALGIAITPDGKRALVAVDNGAEEGVVPIDIATNTAGAPLAVGDHPDAIAVTPDGTRAYVADRVGEEVRPITLATNAVGAAIPLPSGVQPEAIAITPDSSLALVLGQDKGITPIELATNTADPTIELAQHFLGGVAILPDGSRAYVTDEGAGELLPVELPAKTLGTSFNADTSPLAIAIVPDQPPRAAFTASPSTTKPGVGVGFDASASADTDGGTVARYDWDFGDGTSLADGGPAPIHSFAKEGSYTVTLTTTDNEGCSTEIVFPGQTAFCNGSSIARTTHQVDVRVDCPTASASATSFVPKFRSAHVVPGVRVRLAASDPSRLDIDATLEWSSGGAHRTALEKRTVDVQHFRRIRYTIPGKLRDELPLGTRVTLKLRIAARPLVSSACAGSTTEKTLHVRVVKVIPGAEQHGRRR